MGRKFVCETTRKTNAAGELESIAVTWLERTETVLSMRVLGVILALGTALLVAMALNTEPRFAPFALVLAAMFGVGAVVGLNHGIIERSMIFGVDGSITSPNGIPHERKARKWRFQVKEIRSIEPRIVGTQTHQRYFVSMLMDEGEQFDLAADLGEDQAVMVARRLTKAWGEAHAAQGGGTMWSAAQFR